MNEKWWLRRDKIPRHFLILVVLITITNMASWFWLALMLVDRNKESRRDTNQNNRIILNHEKIDQS